MLLRSRPGRQAESSYWARDYSPDTTPSQRTVSWQVIEESPKRMTPRRSCIYQALPFPSRRIVKRRVVPLFGALICCFLVFYLFRNSESTRFWISHDFKRLEEQHLKETLPVKPSIAQEALTRSTNKGLINNNGEEARVTDTRKIRWPPMVTAIPETRLDSDSLYSGLTTSSIDAQFCGGVSPCRLLLPLWIGEQESRSRMHLTQVFRLARSLNRTLILPGVGRSRIGACARWDFEVYYDVGSFVGPKTEEDKNLVRKVMLMDDFRTWLEMRPGGPAGQLLFVDEKTDVEEDVSKEKFTPNSTEALNVYVDKDSLDLEDPRLRKTRCLPMKYRQLQLDIFSPMSVHIPPVDSFGGHFLADALNQEETFLAARNPKFSKSNPTPEVLILHWDTRHFPFPHLLESLSLDYSTKLHALARRLVQPRMPYVAIHWRMETVQPTLLPDCAETLVDTLVSLLSDPHLGSDIKTVWFASDFPWPVSSIPSADALGSEHQQELMQIASSVRRSNTFRSVSQEHIEAIKIFTAAFRKGGALESWKLTGVSEELERVRREMEREGKGYVLEEDNDEGVLLEDSGVLGILDKVVSMDAALFVSSAKRCGRVSSFTKQITDHRARLQGNIPRNIVDIFG